MIRLLRNSTYWLCTADCGHNVFSEPECPAVWDGRRGGKFLELRFQDLVQNYVLYSTDPPKMRLEKVIRMEVRILSDYYGSLSKRLVCKENLFVACQRARVAEMCTYIQFVKDWTNRTRVAINFTNLWTTSKLSTVLRAWSNSCNTYSIRLSSTDL